MPIRYIFSVNIVQYLKMDFAPKPIRPTFYICVLITQQLLIYIRYRNLIADMQFLCNCINLSVNYMFPICFDCAKYFYSFKNCNVNNPISSW